jgi:hypothetical protein
MYKGYLLIASSLILLSSCASIPESTKSQQQLALSSSQQEPTSSSSIHDAVNNYIETLSKQPESGGGKYRCVQNISEDRLDRIINIQEWQITRTSTSVDKDDPDATSTDVYVKITRDLNGEKIENTWLATVWKTSDLLQHNLRFFENLEELHKSTEKLTKQVNSLTGDTSGTENKIQKDVPVTINKSGYSSETFCVTRISKIYK